ncbi:hypothetical protein ON010_g17042 [Phytophthora cinnamomi]|nr:hypothetical protein ON010_g17042 [Phytophthora cinnamomi]
MGGQNTLDSHRHSPPLRGTARVFTPERSSSLMPALSPIDTKAFTAASRTSRSGYQPPQSQFASWYTVQTPAKTSRYLATSSTHALSMVATYVGGNRPSQIPTETARPRQEARNHRADAARQHPVLELQRNRLFHGGQQNVWNVVVEYFHVFGFGVPVTLSVESIDSADMTVDCLENAEAKHQLVPAVEDVVLGERSGVDALMDQWCRYSSSFQGLYFQLERIERVGDHFVCVTAVMNVTVTKATLTNVFPHLQDDGKEQGGRGSKYRDETEARRLSLRSRLVGRRLVLPCSICFEWDPGNDCVSCLETTTNFLVPLTKVLGDLLSVALVLARSVITRDGDVGICALTC